MTDDERKVQQAKEWLWRQVMLSGRVMAAEDVKDFFAGWEINRASNK